MATSLIFILISWSRHGQTSRNAVFSLFFHSISAQSPFPYNLIARAHVCNVYAIFSYFFDKRCLKSSFNGYGGFCDWTSLWRLHRVCLYSAWLAWHPMECFLCTMFSNSFLIIVYCVWIEQDNGSTIQLEYEVARRFFTVRFQFQSTKNCSTKYDSSKVRSCW